MAVYLIASCSNTLIQYNVNYGGVLNTLGVYYLTFTGSTPEGCYIIDGPGSGNDDTIDTVSIDYGDCETCAIEPTPTPTTTTTPSPTPTLTPTATVTSATPTPTVTPFYQYYFTGCCGGETFRITSGTDLGLNIGEIRYLSFSGGSVQRCFEVVSPIPLSDITYIWNPGGGDTLSLIYPTCSDCITANPSAECSGDVLITSCENPLIQYVVNYGATYPSIGSVFYYEFTGSTPSGCYTFTSTFASGPIDGVTTKTPYVDCITCQSSIPSPTPTETQTPTPTVTPTVTNTPSITPTEIADVYLFEECGNASNQFRYSNVPGTLIVGDVYLISGPYFNGYATVITYSAVGTLYPSAGSVFTNQASCPTPTPTPSVTATQTLTPSVTATVTPSGGPCAGPYCFRTTLPSLSAYSGNYVFTGTYGGYFYYVGDGTTTGYVFHNGDGWCLSGSLGGSCLLAGTTPCTSLCPDISANNFTEGPCPTPTPSPVNCSTFDFNAYFDCDWEPLPTPSPSVDCGDVDFDVTSLGVTPTPTPTGNSCGSTGVSFSICQYNQPTPTATPTPTITLTKTVDVQGQATFVMLDELFSCVNVKVLVDCQSGESLYTSDDLVFSGTPITTGITISAIISGRLRCVTYSGTTDLISSNCNIDDIISISSSCGTCNSFPSPTPSATPTLTPTASNTPTPTIPVTVVPIKTPTPTPVWRYVYESCEPLGNQTKKTQIIQTVKVSPSTITVNKTFQDSQGVCWKYIGQFPVSYIPPTTVNGLNFTGNYMGGPTYVANPVFDNCTDCLNWPGTSVEFFGGYSPSATSAQNACLNYNTGRPYYTNTPNLAVGVRVYDTYTSVPTNGGNNWIVLKIDTALSAGVAVQIDNSGYIIAIQNVDTNSCS